MPMNRIQFQPGLSMPGLFEQFGTEAQSEGTLERARWPQGFHCPHCGYMGHYVLRVRARKTFQCKACRHQTSLIAVTLFQGTQASAERVVSGDLPDQSSQDRTLGVGVETPTRSQLPHRLARSPQLLQAMIL